MCVSPNYLNAENCGGGEVNAKKAAQSESETFKIYGPDGKSEGPIQNGDKVVIKTFDGIHYVTAENGGGSGVKADRLKPQEWETFTIKYT